MHDPRLTSRHFLPAGMFLLAGVLATGHLGQSVKADLDRQARGQFAFACEEVRLKIEARLQAHRQVLLGGAALFDASDNITRAEWRAYARRLEIDQHFNGILGLGFAQLIPKERLARHVAEIRREGFPDYTVRPAGGREVYTSIVYLEPFEGRNLRAFGFDMYSEPVRRAAMERARDDNTVALSGKVVLVQETGRDVQAGTLMYAPVYRKGAPVETAAQRRAALLGWVYSPFRMKDLLQGVLQGRDGGRGGRLRLRVYDGPAARPESLLYASDPPADGAGGGFALALRAGFAGRGWTLQFEEAGTAGRDYGKAWIALAGGLAASVLLSLLVFSYQNTRRRALAIAGALTAEMQERAAVEAALNARLRLKDAALNACANAVVITDTRGVVEWANPAFAALTGYGPEESLGKSPKDLVKSGAQDQPFYERLWQTILSGRPWRGELVNRRKDGALYHEEMTITPVPGAEGGAAHFVAVKQDITDRKRTEEKLRELNQDFVAFLENTTDFVYFKDAGGRLRFCSQALADIAGHASWREMVGMRDQDVSPGKAGRICCGEEQAVFRDGKPLLNRIDPYCGADQRPRWVSTSTWPLFDGGKVVGLFGIGRDISDRVEVERRLKLREALFRGLFEQSIFLAGILDEADRLVEVNTLALEAIKAGPKDVLGRYFPDTPWWRLPEDRERLVKALRAARAGRPSGFEATHPAAGGGTMRVMFNAKPIFTEGQMRIAVTGVDVTQRWLAETALRESERRFHTMADNAPVLIWTAGLDKLRDYFNKVWLDFTGRALEQELGEGWADGVHPDDLRRCLETYLAAFDARSEFTMEYRLRRRDGQYRWLTDRGVPRYDEQGNFFGYIGSCIDITERHEMEELVRQLAFYDPLTKLANRRLLEDRLGQAMAAARRRGHCGALMFLDLDNFKPLNDRHGHAAGDLLLVEAAGRLVHCVRGTDTVARFGGDEFVVLLGELDVGAAASAAQARQVAEKIRLALAEPYRLAPPGEDGGGGPILHRCTASIGAALFGPGEADLNAVLQRADEAMYRAKEAGRNSVCLDGAEGGEAAAP